MENIEDFLGSTCFWYKKSHVMNNSYHFKSQMDNKKPDEKPKPEYSVTIANGYSPHFKYAVESFDANAKIANITDTQKKVFSSISLFDLSHLTMVKEVKFMNHIKYEGTPFPRKDQEKNRIQRKIIRKYTPEEQNKLVPFDIEAVSKHHEGLNAIPEVVDYVGLLKETSKIKCDFTREALKDLAIVYGEKSDILRNLSQFQKLRLMNEIINAVDSFKD